MNKYKDEEDLVVDKNEHSLYELTNLNPIKFQLKTRSDYGVVLKIDEQRGGSPVKLSDRTK